MRVCVKTYPTKYDLHWYDKKQPDFLVKREKQWKISQKSNLIAYEGLATLIWYTTPKMQHPNFLLVPWRTR
jgi:hypothetical protein